MLTLIMHHRLFFVMAIRLQLRCQGLACVKTGSHGKYRVCVPGHAASTKQARGYEIIDVDHEKSKAGGRVYFWGPGWVCFLSLSLISSGPGSPDVPRAHMGVWRIARAGSETKSSWPRPGN